MLPIATDPQSDGSDTPLLFKVDIDTMIKAMDLWLLVIVYLLIHTFHCIQGAYAAILTDTSDVTMTLTAMCHAEVQ